MTSATGDRVLIVEDDQALGARLKRIMERASISVDIAENVGEALARLERGGYSVALVDIMLTNDPSDRGGMEVIRRLAETKAGTYVIVLSATNDVRVPVEAWRQGVDQYLMKRDIRSSEDVIAPVLSALKKRDRARHRRKGWRRAAATQLASGGSKTQRFGQLSSEWRLQSQHISSPVEMAMLPAYQQIIGMGLDALPLILRELQQEADHWFWALRAITGIDPVPKSSAGKIEEMRDAWLAWGYERGIL